MKIIAMYLPQFHRVKENDEWWGEGFTEWTAVKHAEELYSGHNQPRVPWKKNYYNLLEKETMVWQSQLMKKYGIDGFCMYHYWFKNGRQILEKPAENLLHWNDIDMPYCFCWANETWARSWSRIQEKNTWADQYEKNGQENKNGILLEQNYGQEEQWKQHFYYLLPFFKDSRYIYIDEKPVFLIYKAGDIYCLPQMLEFWNILAVKEGLKGVYVIGAGCYMENISCMDGRMYAEPGHSYGLLNRKLIRQENGVRIVDYSDLWKQLLNSRQHQNMYYEGVIGYDDTPRRGICGWVLEGVSPEKFGFYLAELLARSEVNGSQCVFLNAWNEWGEGMYLEPDDAYQTAYLEAVLKAKREYVSHKAECADNQFSQSYSYSRVEQERDHFIKKILDRWVTLYEENFCIGTWFQKKNMKKIAIYGFGVLGKHLYKQLVESHVEVAYVIDQEKARLNIEADVYAPQEVLPAVDCIVVTACYDFDYIYQMLTKKKIGKVISLAAVLFDQGF